MTDYIKYCKTCGVPFSKPIHASRQRWIYEYKYCSNSCVNIGRVPSEETKKKLRDKSIGRKHTDAAKLKMSGANCHLWKGGKKNKCNTCNKEIPNAYAKRCYPCYAKTAIGSNSANWKGGKGALKALIRSSVKYNHWRMAVFARDNYTCVTCSKNGGILHVDHIKKFSEIIQENEIINIDMANTCKELWDTNNGRVLCIDCHRKTDTWGNQNRNEKGMFCSLLKATNTQKL